MGIPSNYDDLPMGWVGDVIGRRAMSNRDREALYDAATNSRFTFGELNQRANSTATYLVDVLGMKKGDRLCLLCRNRLEAVDLFFACSKVGIILSPLSYHLQKPELEELMVRIQPCMLVYEDIFAEMVGNWILPSSVEHKIELSDSSDSFFQQEVLSTPPRADIKTDLAMNDTQMYIHTGGTTAVPKICIIPYRQMVWNAFEVFIAASSGVGGVELRELLTFPFFHIGGWNVLNSTVYIGGVSIMMRDFDPDLLLDLI